VIAGDAGALVSLTDSARQRPIDIAVQVINEGIDELYTTSQVPLPNEQAEGTVVLLLNTRNYTLASGLVQLRWPMIDKTNTQFLYEYPGGYNAMLLGDPEQDDTGLPYYGAIRPTDGALYLDRAPTSVEVGRTYTYQYDKDVVLSLATDTVPFKDEVFRAMVPAWAQLWKRDMRQEFDGDLYRMNLGRAARVLTQRQPRTDYSPR
jgi:hypothetical protein